MGGHNAVPQEGQKIGGGFSPCFQMATRKSPAGTAEAMYLVELLQPPAFYNGSMESIAVVIVHASSAGIRFNSWPGPHGSE